MISSESWVSAIAIASLAIAFDFTAGLINIVEYTLAKMGRDRIYAIIGGTHLGFASNEQFDQTLAVFDRFHIELVEELGPRRGFYGNSIEVELFDYVQMVALSARDKLVKVTTPVNEGKIWFEHGDIVHAEFESHVRNCRQTA